MFKVIRKDLSHVKIAPVYTPIVRSVNSPKGMKYYESIIPPF